MKCKDKPDYHFWAKKETWSVKESALLLHRLDPMKNKDFKPYKSDVPLEFSQEACTYLLLKSIPWDRRYDDCYRFGEGIRPRAIITEAVKKDLPMPKALVNAVTARYKREETLANEIQVDKRIYNEIGVSHRVIKENITKDSSPLTTRERRNLLKTIGVLTHLLFMDGKNAAPKYSRGGKFNAYQAAQTVLDKAQALGLAIDGLKSLDRKITEALDVLAEET